MTTVAREVLSDCRGAFADFCSSAEGHPAWRRQWVALVALLRAVGHVLHKQDGATSVLARNVIDDAFEQLKRTRPEPAIYWQFIEEERNNLLKAYNFGVNRIVTIHFGGADRITNREDDSAGNASSVSAWSEILDGPFKGQNAVAVADCAIRWWEQYLDEVDSQLARSR